MERRSTRSAEHVGEEVAFVGGGVAGGVGCVDCVALLAGDADLDAVSGGEEAGVAEGDGVGEVGGHVSGWLMSQ